MAPISYKTTQRNKVVLDAYQKQYHTTRNGFYWLSLSLFRPFEQKFSLEQMNGIPQMLIDDVTAVDPLLPSVKQKIWSSCAALSASLSWASSPLVASSSAMAIFANSPASAKYSTAPSMQSTNPRSRVGVSEMEKSESCCHSGRCLAGNTEQRKGGRQLSMCHL